jgi:hypothetical protein
MPKTKSKRLINIMVVFLFTYWLGVMKQNAISIKESIPVEIYNKLLDFGNGKLEDGIENAVYLAYTMEVIQKSQINETIEIWGRIFYNDHTV